MSDPPSIYDQFKQFYRDNWRRFLNYAASQTPRNSAPRNSEDLVQEVFVKAWDRLCRDQTFNNWEGWIFQRIRWRAADAARACKTSAIDLAVPPDADGNANALDQITDSEPLPDENVNRPDRAELVKKAISAMKKPDEKRLIELYYLDSANHPTLLSVATAMGITPSNAKQLHKRAKASLKKALRGLANS